jgi:hypothetical protein
MSASATQSRPDAAAETLAGKIGAYAPKPRDAKTVARARSAIILAFGRTLSGAPAPISKALLATPGAVFAGGQSLVFGTERRTSALDAALANATAAAAGSDAAINAANAAFIVSLYGLCEERQKTGHAFLDALTFGAEVALALAPTGGQVGAASFGAVAAATRLLELSPAKIAAALLVAGVSNHDSARGGLPSLAVGLSLKNALLAALLAETMDDASCAEMVKSETAIAPGSDVPAQATLDLLAVRSPPGADMWDQFERQTSAVLPRDSIGPLLERLETIDKVTDLASVSRLLQGRATQAAPTKVVFASRGAHEPEETNWVP